MLDLLLKCATDLDFDALRGELDKLKSEALGLLASTIADAKAALSAQMDAFETTIRGWIPELPDIPVSPGDPMLPELLALAASASALASIVEPVTKAVAQKAYDLAYAAFKEKYADAIAKAGSQIDTLIEGLNGGIDPCSLVPNILTLANGTVAEVPKIPLYAKKDPEPELPSEITPAMVTKMDKIDTDRAVLRANAKAAEAAFQTKRDASAAASQTTKESLSKDEISRDTYYKETITEIEDSVDVVSEEHPSTLKQTLENTRQGTDLGDPQVIWKFYSYIFKLKGKGSMFYHYVSSAVWNETISTDPVTGTERTSYFLSSGDEWEDEIRAGMYDPEMAESDLFFKYTLVKKDTRNDYHKKDTPFDIVTGNKTEKYYDFNYYFEEK